jgi:hypothetical protein
MSIDKQRHRDFIPRIGVYPDASNEAGGDTWRAAEAEGSTRGVWHDAPPRKAYIELWPVATLPRSVP